MDDYYNDRPQQVPGAQKKRTSLYDVDASRAQGVEVFENPLRAKAAAKAAQLMPASSSANDDAPTIVPTFPASKFVVEEETSGNYMEEGDKNNSSSKVGDSANRISGGTHDVNLHDISSDEMKNQSSYYAIYVKMYSMLDVTIMFIMTVYCVCALSQDAMSFSEIGFKGELLYEDFIGETTEGVSCLEIVNELKNIHCSSGPATMMYVACSFGSSNALIVLLLLWILFYAFLIGLRVQAAWQYEYNDLRWHIAHDALKNDDTHLNLIYTGGLMTVVTFFTFIGYLGKRHNSMEVVPAFSYLFINLYILGDLGVETFTGLKNFQLSDFNLQLPYTIPTEYSERLTTLYGIRIYSSLDILFTEMNQALLRSVLENDDKYIKQYCDKDVITELFLKLKPCKIAAPH